jgi:inosose dehydratase
MNDLSTHIRFGTDLITFFDTKYWGIEPKPTYEKWIQIFESSPRAFFDRMLDDCVKAGVEGVELAPIPGGWRNAEIAYGSAQGFKSALQERNLVLSSSFDFGAPLFLDADDQAADNDMREHSRFVSAVGGSHIVLGSVTRAQINGGDVNGAVPHEIFDSVGTRLRTLGSIAAESGLTIALHTDAYSICCRPEDIREIMDRTSESNVGLCLDAGHVTLDGNDAVAILKHNIERVPMMHWKDCISSLDGSTLNGPVMERHETMLTYFRVLGSGIVDWKSWQEILRDANWSGWAIAEIDMSPDPIGEIRQGLEFFQRELSRIYV